MDPLQQEHMVAEYARTYGRITRSQAANLCQLSSVEAGRLLKRMTDKGTPAAGLSPRELGVARLRATGRASRLTTGHEYGYAVGRRAGALPPPGPRARR